MKSVENISPLLEKVVLTGLNAANEHIEIKVHNTSISLYNIGDTIFVHYKHFNSFANKSTSSLYEIRFKESFYLFDTIRSLVQDIDDYGKDAGVQDTLTVYSKVIEFCKKVNFQYKDFEIALENLLKN